MVSVSIMSVFQMMVPQKQSFTTAVQAAVCETMARSASNAGNRCEAAANGRTIPPQDPHVRWLSKSDGLEGVEVSSSACAAKASKRRMSRR